MKVNCSSLRSAIYIHMSKMYQMYNVDKVYPWKSYGRMEDSRVIYCHVILLLTFHKATLLVVPIADTIYTQSLRKKASNFGFKIV